MIALAVLLGAGSAQAQESQAQPGEFQDRVEMVSGKDAAMNAAIASARANLPTFWKRFEQRGPQGFLLKVALPTAHGGTEHIWVDNIRRKDGVITAEIGDDPDDLPDLKLGSQITVDPASISDWGYPGADGRRYGMFTTRVLLHTLTPSEQAQIQAVLQPEPLETGVR